MKTILSLMAAVLVLAVSLTACGGSNTAGAVGTTTAAPYATNGSTQKPASGGSSWGDIPVYPGATQTQGTGGQVTLPGNEFSKIEARYYETGDAADKVENFYKDRMLGDGWKLQGGGWVEVGMMIGAYVNNSATESLQISILPPGPGAKTVINLVKGTK